MATSEQTEWPLDRRRELEQLQTLLYECSSINQGSHVLERLEKVIAIAKELNAGSFEKARLSFMQFLIQQAAASTNAE